MASEISFPRGGRQTFSKSNKREANEDLFQTKETHEKKKSKSKSKKRKADSNDPDEELVVIESLTNRNITQGIVVLGCITKVFKYYVVFSLPGGVTGQVPITNMSFSYVELLKQYAENPDEYEDALLTMPNMFKVGDCYPVKVTDFSLTESSSKTRIQLSLNPRDINEDLTSSSIFNGMTILGAVSSVEDHGYIIDIGINGLSGFLSTKNASHHIQKVNQGRNLSLGEILLMVVNMPELDDGSLESRTITLTTKKKLFEQDVSENVSLQNILPGISLPAIITAKNNNGLAVKCLSYNGCIHKDSLKNPFDNPESYKLGEEVKATVLYKHPLTQVIHLTLVPKSSSSNLSSRFGKICIGDKFEKAHIIEVHPHSVYVKLSENVKGLAKTPHIFDREVDNASDILQPGGTVDCRVLNFNYVDRIAKISLKKSVLKQAFIENESIKPGDVVKGTVEKIDSSGLIVKLGLYVQGFVPLIHLSDIPLTHPEKHFHVGGEITCRVLKLDKNDGGSSHFLTCKKTLVNSKLPPLTSLENVMQGMIFDGFVIKASSSGILVAFYNDLKGWVPSNEISTTRVEFPEKVFYTGQVVKCRILSVSPITKQMKLSMKLATRAGIGKKDMGLKYKLTVGDVVSAKVMGKNDKGVDVVIMPNECPAFIPSMHLSDHPHLCKILHENYEAGDIIKKTCIFNLKGTVICSMKAMFLKAASKGKMVSAMSQLKESDILPCVIKGFMAYGIIVEMGNNVSGLVHKTKISNGKVQNPGLLGFVTHQSLIVRVSKLYEKEGVPRAELSGRLVDVLSTKDLWKPALNHLEAYLKDCQRLATLQIEHNKSLIGSYRAGQVVNVGINKVTQEGVLCQIVDSEVKGFVVLNNIGAKVPVEGSECQALVLSIDFFNQCLELSLCYRLVKHTLKLQSKESTALSRVNKYSIQRCEILLIRKHFVLAVLLDHVYGVLAYLPIKKHPNDTVGNLYGTGKKARMIVYRVKENYVIGVLESHEVQARKDQEKVLTKQSSSLASPQKKNPEQATCLKRKGSEDAIDKAPSAKKKDLLKRKAEETAGSESPKKKANSGNEVNTETLCGASISVNTKEKGEMLFQEKAKLKSLPKNFKIGDIVEGTVSCLVLGKVYVDINSSLIGFFRISDLKDNQSELTKSGKKVALEILSISSEEIEFKAPVSPKVVESSWAKIGQTLDGVISHITNDKVFLKFSNNKFGFVCKHELTDDQLKLPLGTRVTAKVTMIIDEEVNISIIGIDGKSILYKNHKGSKEKQDNSDELTEGSVVQGSVQYWRKGRVFVRLAPKKTGIIFKSAIPNGLENLKTGSQVRVEITKANEKGYDLKLIQNLDAPSKAISFDVPIINVDPSLQNGVKDEIAMTAPSLQLPDTFVWEIDATPNMSTFMQDNKVDDESSSDDENETKDTKKKRKKGEILKEEEELLRKQEERLMDLGRLPETIDDFERLVLSAPDNSMVWLKYMAFHLQQTEIDKARVIAERALKTISFREEKEKFNIWVSLLNLENMYGTPDSLNEIFTKALEVNEPLNVYRQMISIYSESEKMEEAEELYQTVVKKYRQDPSVWTNFGLFYMKSKRPELARKLMERSFNSIDKRNHIEIISKFAQLEFNFGDPERGKTLFKNVLNNYPKRTDIWSVLIDVLVKHGDFDEARQNLEKLSSSSLPMKKMKFVFKKFLDFEKEHGSDETVEKVKLKALHYVQTSNGAT